ncbi:hypothetical protein [Niveibacterium umoris]|nr:hypothetical protein [Niveibacterium umoris]
MMAEPKGSGDRLSRSVLEAVDGFSTVGELGTRLKDAKGVVRALAELERAGLIETLDARMARVAEQEARMVRGENFSERQEPSEVGRAPAAPATPPSKPQAAAKQKKVEVDQRRLERALSSGSNASVLDHVRVFFGNLGHNAIAGGGEKARKVRRAFVILAALAVVGGIGAAVAALGWQVSTLRQRVEHDAALWLGEPVRVARVGVAFHPWPVFELNDIQIGEGGSSHIDKAWGGPDWIDWMMSQPQRLAVSIKGARIEPALLLRLAGLGSSGDVWRLREVEVEALDIPVGKVPLGALSGAFMFARDGRWESARLRPQEVEVTYELLAQDGSVVASVIAPEAKFGATKLENLLVTGKLGLSGIDGAQFGANWLGGSVKGSVDINLGDAFGVKAQVNLDSVGFDALSGLLGAPTLVLGRVSGPMTVAGSADKFSELSKVLRWSGNYKVADGAINRIDLLEAMRRNGNGPISGGVTRFALMEGAFSKEPEKGSKIEIRHLSAGALSASGRVLIDESLNLRGALRCEVKTPVERLARLFAVEGTLQTFQLRPQGE